MYQRKTRDVYDVMVAYNFGNYETVCTEFTRKEANQRRMEYIRNDEFALSVIVKKRREKIKEEK